MTKLLIGLYHDEPRPEPHRCEARYTERCAGCGLTYATAGRGCGDDRPPRADR